MTGATGAKVRCETAGWRTVMTDVYSPLTPFLRVRWSSASSGMLA